jgi:hypothetical protein
LGDEIKMSQHVINKRVEGINLRVQMGWDTPTSCYYLVIENIDANNDVDRYLYSNLYETNPATISLDGNVKTCKKFGIDIPTEMITAIQSDRVTSKMNNIVFYD